MRDAQKGCTRQSRSTRTRRVTLAIARAADWPDNYSGGWVRRSRSFLVTAKEQIGFLLRRGLERLRVELGRWGVRA